jgi:hypothetical protein
MIKNNSNIIKTIDIPKGIILLHGNGDINNIKLSNKKMEDDKKEIKFFNTKYSGCTSYADNNKKNISDKSYIGLYYVIEPIKIYVQYNNADVFYYDNINEYKNIVQ